MCDKFKVPTKTDELIQLVDFIDHIKNNVLPELTNTVGEVWLCQYFLADYAVYTKDDLEQNSTTFYWVQYINELISKSPKIINDKKIEFKEFLQERKNKLKSNLNIYKLEVDEYRQLGDLNDINMYAEKTHNMDEQLTEAMEQIDEINKEEKYFGLKESTYPFRKIVNKYRPLSE